MEINPFSCNCFNALSETDSTIVIFLPYFLVSSMYIGLSFSLGDHKNNPFNWYQIFALDSAAVVEVQEMFSSHGGHLTNAM